SLRNRAALQGWHRGSASARVRNRGASCPPHHAAGSGEGVKTLVAGFAYNEGEKIKRTLSRHPEDRSYDLMVMDDGTTDGSLSGPGLERVIILRNDTNQGVGAAMKK